MVACHSAGRFHGAAAQQHRQQHQTSTVGRCHQKRPDRQISEAHPHTHPTRVMMPYQTENSKADQDRGDGVADGDKRQGHAEKHCCQHHAADGQGVADRNGDERSPYYAPPLFLHP